MVLEIRIELISIAYQASALPLSYSRLWSKDKELNLNLWIFSPANSHQVFDLSIGDS